MKKQNYLPQRDIGLPYEHEILIKTLEQQFDYKILTQILGQTEIPHKDNWKML